MNIYQWQTLQFYKQWLNGTYFSLTHATIKKKRGNPGGFLDNFKKSILVQVSNAVFIISDDIVGSRLFPEVVVCGGLTKANHSRNLPIIILGVCTVELQTVFWVKENSIGTGIG